MKNPSVSVITPCFNADKYISSCLESVQNQTFQDWEHIVIDDNSKDDSSGIIKDYADKDPRILFKSIQHNTGTAAGRNSAITASRGRYIAFLDADDLWLPEKLEVQLGLMKQHAWAFTFSDYAIINQEGVTVRDRVGIPSYVEYEDLLKNTVIGCLTVVIDSHKIHDLVMPALRSGQDYALWYRILRSGFVANGIERVLAKYRIVPGSLSRNKIYAARRMWRLYREYENINVLRSSWYFMNYAYNSFKRRF